MQAFKRISVTEDSNIPYVKRPVYYGGAVAVSNVTVESDMWCQEIASFLSACGVNAVWEAREGNEYKWVWINNHPCLFYKTSHDAVLKVAFGAGGSKTFSTSTNTSSTVANVVLSFCGNPKGWFILRIFTSSIDYGDAIAIGSVVSRISAKSFFAFEPVSYTASASQNYTAIFWNETNAFYDAAATNKISPNSIPKLPLLTADIGDKIPMVMVECSPYFVVPGVYVMPKGYPDIPEANLRTSMYQTEFSIGGKKFLSAANSSSGNYFKFGLIQLDDNDPLISEIDFNNGGGEIV